MNKHDLPWEEKTKTFKPEHSSFLYNVIDRYKEFSKEEIIADMRKNEFPAAILMINLEADFNIATAFRSGNFFNFSKLMYFGKKKRDKRGEVGVFNYSNIQYLDSIDKIKELKNEYRFVALENNIDKNPTNISKYKWDKKSLIVFGSESRGIEKEILDLCDDFIEIKGFGSCRSLNASTAISIAMFDYINKYE
ncbi:MAG: TrmH family RNA methyltransferase [Chitinophagales bacterium]|nr:TrmH family RNA methyltransferase [Chitinophagales bacterium]